MNQHVFVVGQNDCGELCSGDKKPIKSLTSLYSLNPSLRIDNINPGYLYTIIATQNDQHLGIGHNYCGECGVGNFEYQLLKPVEMNYFKLNNIKIQQIITSAQSYNTVFLTIDHKVYITGNNDRNQCGLLDNYNEEIGTPHLIQNIDEITNVKQGYGHILLLDKQGIVYSTYIHYSAGEHGQNGFGSISFKDVKEYGFHPIKAFENRTIIKISAGYYHSLFLDDQNVLWGCGYNSAGQLGLGHTNGTKDKLPAPNYYFQKNNIIIKDITSGNNQNLILDVNGNVHSFGKNEYGQCGSGTDDKSIPTPTLITEAITSKVITIKCGAYHSYFATESNHHFLFGHNNHNQVSLTSYPSEIDPETKIKSPHSINNTFNTITDHRQSIKSVKLGYQCTWIISEPRTSTLIPEPNLNNIKLHKILVLLICVGTYDSDKMHDLNGTSTDKSRLTSLFTKYYNYKVISNPRPRVTEDNLNQLLLNAAKEFKRKDITYQAILVFYSGHGDTNHLLLSDYDHESDGIYDRSKFLSFFNGANIKQKAADYKLFFVDSCRGNQLAKVIPLAPASSGVAIHRGNESIHPEHNRGIMYGNPDSYQSYEIPYDEVSDDIAWSRLTKQNYMNNKDRKRCGIFTNSIYHVFLDNATKYGFSKNYLEMQDLIKEKAAKEVPVKGDYVIKVAQKIENSDTLKGKTKLNMYFMNAKTANSQNIDSNNHEEKEMDNAQQQDKHVNLANNDKEQIVSKSDPEGLLKQWSLERYTEKLVDEEGWDDPEDWKDIELDYLVEIGFKMGHARKFIRKAKELYQ